MNLMKFSKYLMAAGLSLAPALAATMAGAQDAAAPAAEAVAEVAGPVMDKGDVAWMMTSTLLVLFMTMPGLALFYGGLVRTKNMLSVLMQCTLITAMVIVVWVLSVLQPVVLLPLTAW